MKRSGRLRKGLIFLLVLVVAGLALVGCARLYLTSRHASSQLAGKLQAVLGVPVRIDEADIGFKGESSLSGLQVFEANGQRPDKPWLTVQSVRTDLSALDVVGGDTTPRRVVLTGAAIELTFDENGQLLTGLPSIKPTGQPAPQLVLEHSRLTLAQEGRPPMVIEGLDAEASDRDGVLEFHGTIRDDYWGEWTVEGTFKTAEGQFDLKLKTPRTEITQEKLKRLPFVAQSTWQQVELNGVSPVDFELQFKLGTKGSHYKVDLVPENTDVVVTSIDLHADHASGKVTVEDRLVKLREVQGRTADGTIDMPAADLKFRQPVSDMTFDVRVTKVDVHSLPTSWNIPIPEWLKNTPLRLTGQAKLNVQVKNGKAHPVGEGDGDVVVNPLVKFKVRLHADGEKLHFPPPKPSVPDPRKLLPPPKPVSQEQPISAVIENADGPLQCSSQMLVAVPSDVLSAGSRALAQVQRWMKALPPGQEPNYLDVTLSAKDVEIEEFLRQMEQKPPFAVSGKVSFQFEVTIPLDTPNDTRAYKMHGSATSLRLKIAGLEMTDLIAKVTYDNGVLTLDELHGQFAESGGSFDGDGKLQYVPLGDLTLKLRVDRVPVKRALALLPGAEDKGEGTLSGQLDAQVAAKRLRDPLAWEASGSLQSERLVAYGLALTKARLALTVKNGTATAHDLEGQLEGGRVSGNAEVSVADGYPYKGKVELKDADLAALQRLSPNLQPTIPIEGRAGLTADFQGTLTPLSFTSSGTAQATDLTVSAVGVEAVAFQWAQDADRVKLSEVAAKLYEGNVSGSLTIPLKETVGGDAQFKIEAIEVQELSKVAPVVPVQLAGRISGTVSGSLSASAPGKPRELTTQIDLDSPRMRVADIPAEKLRGRVVYRAGAADYHLDGEMLGGRFELEGKRPPAPQPPDKPPDGRLRLQGVRLSRLGAALHLGDTLAPLSGKVEVDLPYRHEGPDRTPVGVGRFSVSNVRWAESEVAESIQGSLRMNASQVQLRDVSGSFGEGALRGTLVLHFKEPERSWFNLQLDGVEASRLLMPLLARLTPAPTSQAVGASMSPIEGALDIHMRGSLGREWRAAGDVALAHGKVYGIEVGEWRLPVNLSYSPRQGTGQLDFAENNAQLARGRTQGRASLRWGTELRLEGTLRFFDADMPTLLRSTGAASKIAGGRTSGRLDFGGDNIHSADDLTATLEASFSQAQALQLPVLEVLARYVAPGQSAMTFQKGDLRATLSRGVVRVRRLSLSNATLQMLVEGTMTLQGRVDLEATASTGTLGINPAALRLLAVRLPALGPLPLATVAQASALLSNRVVLLRVTGTVKNPSVQIDPVQLLTDEAVRFFLGAAVGAPMP